MSHLRQEQLSALLDGALDDRDRDRANAHLAECAECRDELAVLAESDRMLAVSLDHEPGEAYFDQFPDRVMRKIATTAPREVARPQSFWEKLTTPRGLAWAGGVVALLVAVGLGWIGWQDSRSPLQSSATIDRAERQAARAVTPQGSATPSEDAKNKSFREKGNLAGGAKASTPEPANGLRDDRTLAAAPPASKKEHYEYQFEGAPGRSAAQQEKDGLSAAGRADEAKLEAAPQNQAAPSQRQQAVRKTESGEELPVRSRAPAPAATSAAPAPQPAPAAQQPAPVDKVGNRVEAETQVLKQRSASPLQKALDSAAKSSQSTVQGFAATPPAELGQPGAAPEPEAGATSNARIPGLERPSRPNPAQWSEALRPLVARADRYERLANAVGSAANFDSAAVQWERVLAQAPVGPLRVEASHHIAWSRAQSFAIAPTFASRSYARVATERYLEVAPPGVDRERYRQLLGTLR